MEQETYQIDRLCTNCEKVVWLTIPNGITLEEYLKSNPKCPDCGCDLE